MIGYSRNKFVQSVQTEEDDQTKVKMLAPFHIVLYEYVLLNRGSVKFHIVSSENVSTSFCVMEGDEQFT